MDTLSKSESGGNPYDDTKERTFAAFVATDHCREKWGRDPAFYERLAGAQVDSFNSLKAWVKERYPDHYSTDWRKIIGKPYSREAMQKLWSDFLAWKETHD